MVAINDVIRREVNPFDPTTFKPGNFWKEKQDAALTVESIHQEAVAEIEALLDQVAKDQKSRTVLLTGDSGSGKSYLLGRLKRTLNPKAFFAYIGPWSDSDRIRRHILRYTVDSLTQISEGQQESQLILWLKSLSAFTKRSLKQRIFDDSVWGLLQSDRKKFIKHLKTTYKQAGIYNADSFFGVLHDLTDPELYELACEWLRGDDLSEESLQALKVKHSIETEEAAWEILSNLGRIATETQPIVLCFDQLDAPISADPQPLFSVNTTIHNDALKNFLVIISVTTSNWRQSSDRIQMSDKAGIHLEVHLKRINLDQAEALWAFRLHPIHHQANAKPPSPIFPLTRQALEIKFPGGKTDPRNALILGRQEYKKYKDTLVQTSPSKPGSTTPPPPPSPPPIEAEFKLIWQDEYNKMKAKVTKITLLAAPELIRMLQETLAALKMQEIKPKLLSGKYASYSLSYQHPDLKQKIGIVWTEDPNMTSFVHVMNACQKVVQQSLCQTLYLIRAMDVGKPNLTGHQIYKQIFKGTQHRHIKPILSSVHYLATYHSLVNSALANELVVAGKTISLKELEALVRKCEVFNNCTLLHELGIVNKPPIIDQPDLQSVREFLLNLVKTQGYMGKTTLIQNSLSQFSQFNQSKIEEIIQQMIWETKIKVVNPKAPLKDQLVCFVPQG
jgi:GTPase SAR1 family protein